MTGNMVVGEVTNIGRDVEGFQPGDRVLTYGPFSETHTFKPGRRAWKLPDSVDWKSAVCMDPAFFALAAVRDGGVRVGDVVAVFGLGAIGLMAVELALIAGAARVYALDPLEIRRKAAEKLGAHQALDPTETDVGMTVKRDTDGRGADVVIEYSGSRQAMQDALRAVGVGGNVVAGAYPPPYDAGLDFGAESHHNIPNILFSRGCSEPNRDHPRWDTDRLYDACWDLIASGRLTGEDVVYPVVPFEEVINEYPKIAEAPETNIKLGADHSAGGND
jgi:threonine dehydrogenase-like Zn-dependent dehydrogenase